MKLITPADVRKNEYRIHLIRSQLWNMTDEEQVNAGELIQQLKDECAPVWDARSAKIKSERLICMWF